MRNSEYSELLPEKRQAAQPALEALRKELLARMEKLYNDSTGSKLYSNPNWAYCQAHLNGQLSEIKNLIELLKE